MGYSLPNYLDRVNPRRKKDRIKNVDALFDEGEEAAQELAELKRLLYVALTRAETHLIISGSFSEKTEH